MKLIQEIEREQIARLTAERPIPDFGPGDTVRVNLKVIEGNRERIQAFEGVVIAKKNRGINSSFTVRKISYGEGVERIFPLYSPRIESIEVIRKGRVRRAKLYYLRGRTGKAARIVERREEAKATPKARTKPDRDLRRGRRRRENSRGPDLVRENLGQPRRGPSARRHLSALCRPPSRARGDEPAGLRRLARRRP